MTGLRFKLLHMTASPLREVAGVFGLLGLSSFGGPTAHLAYFREEFVHRRNWLPERHYAELVALSQFLPGPGSSQVGMALGYHRAGWAGMFLAWLMFTLPSMTLLMVFALLLGVAGVDGDAGWVRGLLAAAVAVVFHAIAGMTRGMAAGRITATIAVAAGLAVLLLPSPTTHVIVIVLAGLLGMILPGLSDSANADESTDRQLRPVSFRAAVTSLVLFLGLLTGLWFANALLSGFPWLDRIAAYYQAGALVFGGGHVVLPLLEQLVVAPGWVDQNEFLAGYSAAQAVPGPMFTVASYLGVVDSGVPGGLVTTVMIFLPSFLLVPAGLHFWNRWRSNTRLRRAFTAINAAVVGLLGAAFYDPVLTHGITGIPSLAIAVLCWLGLAKWQAPPWAVAAFAAVAGLVLLR